MSDDDYKDNEAVIKEELLLASNIYIDFEYLKYLELGRYLASPKMVSGIYSQLLGRVKDPSFITRVTDEPSVVFGGVPLPEPGPYDDRAVVMSPAFDDVISQIRNYLVEIKSDREVMPQTKPLTITIDLSKVPHISEPLRQRLSTEYSHLFNVPTEVTTVSLRRMAQQSLKFDTYFTASLARFNEQMIKYLDASKLLDKTVFCRRTLPLTELPELRTDPEKCSLTFDNIELVMAAATQFSYTQPPGILT